MDRRINKKLVSLYMLLAEAGFVSESEIIKEAIAPAAIPESKENEDVIILTPTSEPSPSTVSTKPKAEEKVLSKEEIKEIQNLLMTSGFDLPKYGADGILGSETYGALKDFKRKLAEKDRYSGPIDNSINEDLVIKLKEYALLTTLLKDTPRQESSSRGTTNGSILYFGDSQMAGALGRALMGAAGSGKRLAKVGSRASYWASNKDLKKQLELKPEKIIISLNGNGIGGTSDLIKLIKETTPNSRVIWTGAPPPSKKNSSSKTWAKYLKTDEGFLSAYKKRNERNKTVKRMVEAQGWVFINPYDYIKYSEPLSVSGKTIASGYHCNGCDGIHLPSSVANDYVNKIQSLI